MNIADIETRFSKALADKEVWDSVYYTVFRMTMPNRNSFYQDENIPNNWQNTTLLTSAGANSADVFAARFQRIICSDGNKSVILKPQLDLQDEYKELTEYLDARCNEQIINNISNFLEIGYDLVAGTSVYYKHYNKYMKKFTLIPVPIKDVCITRGFEGQIDGFYRTIKCKREEAPSMYREIDPDTKLGGVPTTKENAYEEIELHEATMLNYDDGLWHMYVIHNHELLVDRKDLNCDFGGIAWTRRPGSAYGIGVGVKALPELNQLNALRYYSTFGLMFRAAPMWLVDQEHMLDFERLEMKPMEMIPVASTGRDNPTITPLQLGDDPNTQQWSQTQMEMNIKETMLNDTLPNQTNERLTATEVAARVNRLNVIGNNMVAVAQELMTDIVKWMLWKFQEEGIYQDIETNVLKTYIENMKVELASTVVRNSEAIQAIGMMIDMFNIATPDGSLTATAINKPKLAQEIKDLLKINSSIILTEEQIKQNMQEAAQAEQNANVAREQVAMAREIAVESFKNGNNQNGQV